VNDSKTAVSFDVVTSPQRQLDFNKEIELQNNRLACASEHGPNSVITGGAMSSFSYGDVACKYLGPVK